MDFELHELQYFVAVAEELHFGRASARVGINQSPLSKAITLMEERLGVRLFIRNRGSSSGQGTWVARIRQRRMGEDAGGEVLRDVFCSIDRVGSGGV